MKLIFASDIHGSNFYCNKLKDIVLQENPDKLILLGDLLYHGPRNPLPQDYNPELVFNSLNSIKEKILAVRGNCDSEVDQMVLEFPMMADYALLSVDGLTLFLTHGHLYNTSQLPFLEDDTHILIHGHTHVNIIQKLEKGYYINCGSLSMPKENQENTYMLYENKKFMIKNLDNITLKEIDFSNIINNNIN
ncbi:MAG: phosphodiesterase [bacterium]